MSDYLDRLIAAGWGDIPGPRIPAAVWAAAEAGAEIPPPPAQLKPGPKARWKRVSIPEPKPCRSGLAVQPIVARKPSRFFADGEKPQVCNRRAKA